MKHSRLMGYTVLLTAVVIVAYVFYLILQTYVLRIEAILCTIALVFSGLELLISIHAAIKFSSQAARLAKAS